MKNLLSPSNSLRISVKAVATHEETYRVVSGADTQLGPLMPGEIYTSPLKLQNTSTKERIYSVRVADVGWLCGGRRVPASALRCLVNLRRSGNQNSGLSGQEREHLEMKVGPLFGGGRRSAWEVDDAPPLYVYRVIVADPPVCRRRSCCVRFACASGRGESRRRKSWRRS